MFRPTRLLRHLVPALVLAASAGCQTIPLHELEWHELETPHFSIVSSLSPGETRTLGRDLELFRAGIEYVIGVALPEPRRKPLVYGFDGRSIVRPFDVRGRSSYMISRLDEPILVFRAGDGFEDGLEETLHDYVHFVVRQTDRRRPLWYEEGIAQVASTIEPRGGHARVAPPRLDHLRTLRDWARNSIDPTLEAGDLVGWTLRDQGRFIAESWALTHYAVLASSSRRASERPLIRFRNALDGGAPPGQSARIAFGARGEELASSVRDYISQDRLNLASVTPRNKWEAGEAPLETLSKAEGRVRLGELSLALGRIDDARRYLRMANDESVAGLGLAAVSRHRGISTTPCAAPSRPRRSTPKTPGRRSSWAGCTWRWRRRRRTAGGST